MTLLTPSAGTPTAFAAPWPARSKRVASSSPPKSRRARASIGSLRRPRRQCAAAAAEAAMDPHDDIAAREARVAAEVAAIGQMDLEALRRLWSTTIGPPPKLRSATLLRLHLAWRLQAQAFGGLEVEARRALRKS